VLADQDGNPARALAAYKDLAIQEFGAGHRLYALMILRLLGQKRESEAICLDLTKRPDQFPINRHEAYRRRLEYAAGLLAADQLLAASTASRLDLCGAHYFIAITLLAEGERHAAREHFRAAFATHARSLLAHDMSWAFLGRMEADPTWPPWIPVKK
jgi:hypothetical protein